MPFDVARASAKEDVSVGDGAVISCGNGLESLDLVAAVPSLLNRQFGGRERGRAGGSFS